MSSSSLIAAISWRSRSQSVILPRAQHDDRRQGRQDQVLVRLLEQQPAAHQFRLGLGLDVRLDQDGAGVPEAQIGRPR
jgi:hypothetical protein